MTAVDRLRALREVSESADLPESVRFMAACRAAYDALPALTEVAQAAQELGHDVPNCPGWHRGEGPLDGRCVCGRDALEAALDRLEAL